MYSFKNISNLMLTNIFNKNNYIIQNKISESTIYIFHISLMSGLIEK